MATVRVFVGTRKGAFILTADGTRRDWQVAGPLFAGWEVYHVAASPASPDRLWAAPSSGWFGQQIHRSDDGGATFTPVGNEFGYLGDPGTHQWYDGTSRPWEFTRVWLLKPSPTDPETVWAGVQDAGLFRSDDGGSSWGEMAGLRDVRGSEWMPGAGGMCLHTVLFDRERPARITVAISAAGAFRSDDTGATWRPINRGLTSEFLPDQDAEVGHCVHGIAAHPDRPATLFMQNHGGVLRSDDGGELWHDIAGDLPSNFGFAIDVHAHEPDTVYVVPITSGELHFPPDGRLRVYRSRTGGTEWEPLTNGLPQRDCYVNVLRTALAVDTLEECGLYLGTTGGQIYVSADGGDNWSAAVRDLPPVLSVEVQTLP